MAQDTVVHVKFRGKADAADMPASVRNAAFRSYETERGECVLVFDAAVFIKNAKLLSTDGNFKRLKRRREVDIAFDMPIYFTSTKVNQNVQVPSQFIKWIHVFGQNSKYRFTSRTLTT